jgi:hypothetical protein
MAMTKRSIGILVTVIGLGALGLAGPASAEKAAPAQQAPAPSDAVTCQIHSQMRGTLVVE